MCACTARVVISTAQSLNVKAQPTLDRGCRQGQDFADDGGRDLQALLEAAIAPKSGCVCSRSSLDDHGGQSDGNLEHPDLDGETFRQPKAEEEVANLLKDGLVLQDRTRHFWAQQSRKSVERNRLDLGRRDLADCGRSTKRFDRDAKRCPEEYGRLGSSRGRVFRLAIGHRGTVHSLNHLLVRGFEQDGDGVQDLRPGVLVELPKGISSTISASTSQKSQHTGKAVSRESPE